MKAASDAVVEYALHALEPEFQCWTAEVNLQIAEFVWNAGGTNLDSTFFHAPGGDLSALVRRLCALRRKVPREVDDVLLLCLDVKDVDGKVHFSFELSWDEGATFHACDVEVDFEPQEPGR